MVGSNGSVVVGVAERGDRSPDGPRAVGYGPPMQNPHIDLGTYGIWTGSLDGVPSAVARECAAEVEQLGFGALWIPETVFRDVFLHALMLLEATTTLKVATGIANRYARDPLTTNAAKETINEAHPGRFLLGLGVSHGHLVAGIRKQEYSRPYSGMVEYLDRMQDALFLAPKGEPPAQMVLAALGPKMLRLAAERTAGAHPYFVPPEHTAIAREVMGEEPLLAVEQMVVLDTDADRARATARAHMAIYLGLPNYANNLKRLGFTDEDFDDGGSDRIVDTVVAWGTMDDGARPSCRRTSTPGPTTCASRCCTPTCRTCHDMSGRSSPQPWGWADPGAGTRPAHPGRPGVAPFQATWRSLRNQRHVSTSPIATTSRSSNEPIAISPPPDEGEGVIRTSRATGSGCSTPSPLARGVSSSWSGSTE